MHFTGNRMPTKVNLFTNNPIAGLIRKAQNHIEQGAGSIDKNESVLQQDRFWLKTVTWTLIGTTVFGVGWLALAKTEEVVVAQGQLKPSGGVKEIRIPAGTMVEEILIKNGEQVTKNQILIRLDQESSSEQLKSLEQSSKDKVIQLTQKDRQLKLKKMAAKKRTTKKASNSIVEPKPTTSSNGRRIAILVIVVLGIVILWRNDPPADEAATTPSSDVINTSGDGWSGDAKDVDSYEPQSSRDLDYTYIMNISPLEALLGKKVKVPHFDGPIEITVPALYNTAKALKANKKGFIRDGQKGDMYIHLEQKLPVRLNEEEKQKIKELLESENFRN